MAINLDGIVLHDAEILVSGLESIFITTNNIKLLSDAFELPFAFSRLSNTRAVVWTGATDAIAVAERIALSWESEGLKIARIDGKNGDKIFVQSFVLA